MIIDAMFAKGKHRLVVSCKSTSDVSRMTRTERNGRLVRRNDNVLDHVPSDACCWLFCLRKDDGLFWVAEFFECDFKSIDHRRRAAEENTGVGIRGGKVSLQNCRRD